MIEFLKENQFLLGIFTGSAAAYILSLFVQWIRRERKILGYSVSSRTITKEKLEELTIKYKNTETKYLHSHSITLSNIGNRPLKDFPVRIECASDGYIFGSEVSAPPGEIFETEIEDPDYITIHCGLLNIGESFTVGLTVLHTPSIGLSLTARQENLKVKQLSQSEIAKDILGALEFSHPIMGLSINLAKIFKKKL
ncbi:MAG: hypothetical protein FVQ85_21775 [Planctomycetes bacterium]|nr:hypothetical protein [Planctomycetota bacterium]